MPWSLPLLLLAAMPSVEADLPAFYDSYTKGHEQAKQVGKPLLVILNPGKDAAKKAISLDEIRKSKTCCDWLDDYVVVIIDTTTKRGALIHKLFEVKSLPHVSVIDKRQEYQIYRSSDPLKLSDWDRILKRYRTGEEVSSANSIEALCPT